jgi:Fe-S oxidoreductase
MFKQELPLLFPDDADVRRSPTRCSTRSSILCCATRTAAEEGLPAAAGQVSYHIPCHSRVQNVGQKTREVLEWIPDTAVTRSSAVPATTARGA